MGRPILLSIQKLTKLVFWKHFGVLLVRLRNRLHHCVPLKISRKMSINSTKFSQNLLWHANREHLMPAIVRNCYRFQPREAYPLMVVQTSGTLPNISRTPHINRLGNHAIPPWEACKTTLDFIPLPSHDFCMLCVEWS